jgi:N-acetyl-alpha-D-muramate 1-phosphate uridylyltransferase
MRPLTDRTPKPLLQAGGRSLIEWQILRLVAAGVRDLVVNISHLGDQIVETLGDGSALGARITYSPETRALETAGGIVTALPLLGEGPFLAVNADIYCEFDFASLTKTARQLDNVAARDRVHLVLVDNPVHHPQGDFALGAAGQVEGAGGSRFTFSGIGLYQSAFFAAIRPGERRPLGPMLYQAAEQGRVSGEHYSGLWMDIGTPERLACLRTLLSRR